MQRSRQTGQRSLHWKRNFSWDVVGEVEFRLKSFKEWSQVFRMFEIVVTSVRNMWRQRSPCTSGWPATLLMNSFKRNPSILLEPKLCFTIRWRASLEYITISQGNTIWIRSDQQISINLANTTKSLQNCFYRTRVRSLVMLVTNSLTHWLTHCCLVNLIYVTLVCEDTNSKLVDIVTVANVDDEDYIGNSVLQIW